MKPMRVRQMDLGIQPGVLARRRRKKTGGHSEDLMGGELLTTVEAAAYMRIPADTLRFWRVRRWQRGPRYLKVHYRAVRYRLCDLEAYLESRLVEPGRDGRGAK
jgi:hypothetical protein